MSMVDLIAAFPVPPAVITVKTGIIRKGTQIYRVHNNKYGPTVFNPGFGNARFSPIADINGKQIPTLYAAADAEGALMETVFHDIPIAPGLRSFDISKMAHSSLSILRVESDIDVAELSGLSAHHLGISESLLIHSEACCYPKTRSWAEAIYASSDTIQGLTWRSKRNTGSFAFMLFGDRVPHGALEVVTGDMPLINAAGVHPQVQALADAIGVRLIDGASF